jgi:hypothetical protein
VSFGGALEETDEHLLLQSIDGLRHYALDLMGGFDIDGWHLRSDVNR